VGYRVGACVGTEVGSCEGARLGNREGRRVGTILGATWDEAKKGVRGRADHPTSFVGLLMWRDSLYHDPALPHHDHRYSHVVALCTQQPCQLSRSSHNRDVIKGNSILTEGAIEGPSVGAVVGTVVGPTVGSDVGSCQRAVAKSQPLQTVTNRYKPLQTVKWLRTVPAGHVLRLPDCLGGCERWFWATSTGSVGTTTHRRRVLRRRLGGAGGRPLRRPGGRPFARGLRRRRGRPLGGPLGGTLCGPRGGPLGGRGGGRLRGVLGGGTGAEDGWKLDIPGG
jgi:hypothetical protein